MAMDSLSFSEDEFPGLNEIWQKSSSTSKERTAPIPKTSGPSPSKSQTASVVRRRKLGCPDDGVLLSRWKRDQMPQSGRRPLSCRNELLDRTYSTKPGLRSRPERNGIEEQRPKAEASTSDSQVEQVSEESSDWSQENENVSIEDEPLNSTGSWSVAKRAVFQRPVPTTLVQELSEELPCQKDLCSPARKPVGCQWRCKCKLPGTPTASAASIGGTSSSPSESQTTLAQPGQGTNCQIAPRTPIKNQGSSLVLPREKPQTPKPPHRPSMDLFWSQEFVDDWNEEYSSKKPTDPVIIYPGLKGSKKIETKAAPFKAAKKSFQQSRQRVAEDFLQELDMKITKGEMATLTSATGGVKIIWSHKLNTTAGRAHWKRESTRPAAHAAEGEAQHRHHASIELAEKVIDDENRLLNVIAHEFCHLANFMISGVTTNPHGKEFKRWATKCSNMFSERGIVVTTKHSYDIEFKYTWECTGCGNEYKRHSKSIDPERQRCGSCKSVLKQTKPVPRVGKQSLRVNFANPSCFENPSQHKTLALKQTCRQYNGEHRINRPAPIFKSPGITPSP